MTPTITDKGTIKFGRARNNRKVVIADSPTTLEAPPPPAPARVPRIARLMALAIKFERLISDGDIADQAELARLGHITRARATQIMNLLQLAPDIQEAILFLPLVNEGRDPIRERGIRRIAAAIDWRKQRKMWQELCEIKNAVND